MERPTLHQVSEVLSHLERSELEELAVQYARSHTAMCHVTSEGTEEPHANVGEIIQRVGEMSVDELVSLLAPTAWISIAVHELHPA